MRWTSTGIRIISQHGHWSVIGTDIGRENVRNVEYQVVHQRLYVKTLSPECELYAHALDNYSPLCFSRKMRFICARNRRWVLDVNFMHLCQTTPLPHLCLKAIQRTCGVQALVLNVNYMHIGKSLLATVSACETYISHR